MPKLILASQSPRRRELLQKLQIPFDSITSNADEQLSENQTHEEAVMELAARKAKAIASDYQEEIVIGADTVVVLNNEILGKPKDREMAKTMLERLSGKQHFVYTGVAVIHQGTIQTFYEKTEVTFWELTKKEIDTYLDSGEPFDKAGSYGIQGLGSLFVKSINGDYYTVVGLPISRLNQFLKENKLI
ncbi:Maf family protein [Bacillus sp. FJAT-49736]|uniref:Maf family protein n=1 Tax=Bacillus sp. FJAT-49736 TaxID=2833582 RepID=UPI001BC99B3B|nr:Maf family protein [Bacillus sp. FJAT-49736]MBS4173702.1 septum formation inhibitor Maf [Bacillus sp. FJAT-49736]